MIEEILDFFKKRPDLFEEMPRFEYLNARDFYVFNCIEFKKSFMDIKDDRFCRLYLGEKNIPFGICFQFSKSFENYEFIYIHRFHQTFKVKIPLEEFFQYDLSEETKSYFTFNADLWKHFDN